MSDIDLSVKKDASVGPRILLTGTNRWPVVPRLVISFRRWGCEIAALYLTPGHLVQDVSVGHIFQYNGLAPVDSLRTAIEAFDPDIIVPSCDRGVQHLHELHAICQSRGNAGRKIAALIERSLGSPDGFPVVSSRYELLKVAQSEGILVPETTPIEGDGDLQLWNAKSAPPWVIKAEGTWGGQGVRIARNATEAKRFVRKFARGAGVVELLKKLLLNRDRDWVLFDWKHSRRSVIAQSLIEGRPANCAVVCWQGKVLASVAVEVIKARGATGPATVVQIVSGSEMIAAAEKIARRLRISGFFGLDFMIEKGTGAIYLIEMNPRCTPPCPLPLGEGHNLVAAFWAQLTGQPLPSNQPAIEQSIIAYSPQAEKGAENVDDVSLKDLVLHDVLQGEPELIQELLHPSSGRSVVGKLIDFARRKQHQETASIIFSTDEIEPPVSKKCTAEPLVEQLRRQCDMTRRETSITTILANSKILLRCFGVYVSQAKRVWNHLSPSMRALPIGRKYARHVDRMVRLHADRKQYFATFFLRNRPELQLLSRLVDDKSYGSRVDIAVLACSKGAEVYSMAWAIRSTRPDLQLNIYAVDISQEILDFASMGIYSIERPDAISAQHQDPQDGKSIVWNTSRDQNAWMFERMSGEEIDAMFEVDGNQASIRSYLRQGITWICGDAGSSSLNAAIGPQDIVVANRFLCHMRPNVAAACLRNIAKMIKPRGHLFVSGIDLDVRTSVALEMDWQPVPDLLREIHDGDDSIRRGWPVEYWGLEPLDDRRTDWQIRYASVFQVGEKVPCECLALAGAEHAGR